MSPFFSIGGRKCLGVAILIRRVVSFSYVKSEIRSNGRGVAAWFSMYNTSFLATHVCSNIHQTLKGCVCAPKRYHMTNSWRKKGQGHSGGPYIVKTRGVPLRIKYQSPLPGAHLRG